MQADELEIRRLIERWAVWRDAGDWERFATVWHPDGVMMATWFQGPFAEFIRVTQEGWAKGVSILHFLGGSAIELAGDRAVAQTKMTISQRGPVDGVLCDVVCTGRFYDFVLRHQGQWKLLHRQPIYEKDRIDPVDPVGHVDARRAGAGRAARRLPAPGLHPAAHRLPGQARHADAQGCSGRGAVSAWCSLARRWRAATMRCVGRPIWADCTVHTFTHRPDAFRHVWCAPPHSRGAPFLVRRHVRRQRFANFLTQLPRGAQRRCPGLEQCGQVCPCGARRWTSQQNLRHAIDLANAAFACTRRPDGGAGVRRPAGGAGVRRLAGGAPACRFAGGRGHG